MTTLARNIMAGIIALLVVTCLALYISNLRYDSKVSSLEIKVSELSNENSILNSRVDTLKKMWFANNEASESQQEGIREKDQDQQTTIKEIEKLPTTGVNNAEDNQSDALPNDLIRLLSEHCNKVRGKACDSP